MELLFVPNSIFSLGHECELIILHPSVRPMAVHPDPVCETDGA